MAVLHSTDLFPNTIWGAIQQHLRVDIKDTAQHSVVNGVVTPIHKCSSLWTEPRLRKTGLQGRKKPVPTPRSSTCRETFLWDTFWNCVLASFGLGTGWDADSKFMQQYLLHNVVMEIKWTKIHKSTRFHVRMPQKGLPLPGLFFFPSLFFETRLLCETVLAALKLTLSLSPLVLQRSLPFLLLTLISQCTRSESALKTQGKKNWIYVICLKRWGQWDGSALKGAPHAGQPDLNALLCPPHICCECACVHT